MIETGDFSRAGVPLDAFEYFAVIRGEHGARWERRRARVRVYTCQCNLIARAPQHAQLADVHWQVAAV